MIRAKMTRMLRKIIRFFVWTLIIAVLIGWKTGHTGRVLGLIRVIVAPQDDTMLSFFAKDAKGVALAQVPLVHWDLDLPPEADDIARDLEDVTGIRLRLDVDTVVFDTDLKVARGRFDWEKISERLTAHGYTVTNERGIPLAVKGKSGDTLAYADPYVIHGHFESVKDALDRFRGDSGLNDESRLAQDLARVGWRHTLAIAVVLEDEAKSIGEVLSGQGRIRGLGGALDAQKAGFPIRALVRAGSRANAKALAESATGLRDQWVEALRKDTDADLLALADALEGARIWVSDGLVVGSMTVPRSMVDRLSEDHERAPKTATRAWQKLAPQLRRAF